MKKNNEIKEMMKNSLTDLPTPPSISSWWNVGFLLGMTTTIQVSTGIILSMSYTSITSNAFSSINSISQNSPEGWMTRLVHVNAATLLFLLIFTHMLRGIWNKSTKKKHQTWMSGLTILVVFMASAFLGYVLPWGQMSFWGATVITNILSAIPYIGKSSVMWMWGGFSVSQPTLNRFFSLHFMMPLIGIVLIVVHLMLLHSKGSTNQTNLQANIDKTKFNPLFSIKDTNVLLMITVIYCLIILTMPKMNVDVENSSMANPLVTPIHIQPEWYFLFAYAILRSIPSKLGGVLALTMSIMIMAKATKKKKSVKTAPMEMKKTWVLTLSFITLSWIGANPIEPPMETMGKVMSILYFSVCLAM